MRKDNNITFFSNNERGWCRLWQQTKDYFLDINRFSVQTVVSEYTSNSCGSSSGALGSSDSIGVV